MIIDFEKYKNEIKVGDILMIKNDRDFFSEKINSPIPISFDIVEIVPYFKEKKYSTKVVKSLIDNRLFTPNKKILKKLNTKKEVDKEVKKIKDKIKKIEDDYILMKEIEKNREKYNL